MKRHTRSGMSRMERKKALIKEGKRLVQQRDYQAQKEREAEEAKEKPEIISE